MRYLGLDLGTKTLGISISDKTNTIASPLKTISFKSIDYNEIFNDLEKIITENNISEVALGLPYNMDGSMGFAAQRSLEFKEAFEKRFSIKITLIDERLTSVVAHNILHENGRKYIDHKKDVDTVAATVILDTFLSRKED